MLVLSRKVDQTIRITTPAGEVIRVTVTRFRRDKVHLGIEAPPEVIILRDELPDREPEPKPEPETAAA